MARMLLRHASAPLALPRKMGCGGLLLSNHRCFSSANASADAVVARRHGSGSEKVLVLHGWFGPGAFNEKFWKFPNPNERFEFAEIHNPGYCDAKGHSTLPNDMTELAKIQLAAADSLGWEKFHIIGHSYGGAAALRIATLAPSRVQSIIGIAPVMPVGFDAVGAANVGADENTGPAFMAAYSKGAKAADGPSMLVGALDPHVGADQDKMDWFLDAIYAGMDDETYKQYFVVWTGASFAEEAKGLDVRSLFISGKQDPFSKPNYYEGTVNSMASGAASVVEIEGGHFPTMTHPDAVAAEISKFYSK